jgi:hypothetical protein
VSVRRESFDKDDEAAPGLFFNTTWTQRVATTDGLPPAAADCNTKTAGKKAKVRYTTDCYFW